MSLQRAFANPSDLRNTAQSKVMLNQSRQQSHQKQEVMCFICGIVAGAFQGFFLPLLVGAATLLFLYLKNPQNSLVEDDYYQNYIIGVLIGCICYYLGWLVAIGAVASILWLSTRQGNIFNKINKLYPMYRELKNFN